MAMIIDPEEVARFRQQLQLLAENLDIQLRRTDTAMETVASQWRDIQFKKYHDQFMQDRDMLVPLREDINAFQEGPLQVFQSNAQIYTEL